MGGCRCCYSFDDHGEQQGKKFPDVVQDLPKVVAAAAEDGKDGIAAGPLEGASGKATVCFHVSDLGFDGAASSQELFQRGCEAAFGP